MLNHILSLVTISNENVCSHNRLFDTNGFHPIMQQIHCNVSPHLYIWDKRFLIYLFVSVRGKDKTDLDVLRENHRFLWRDEDEEDMTW